MIQRIQSVYLLVVTILIIICLCSPVGSYIGSDYSVSALTNLCLTMADGTKDYAPWALFVILLVVAVLAFGTIFLFKKAVANSSDYFQHHFVDRVLCHIGHFYFYVERRVNDIFSFMDCMSAVGCHHFELACHPRHW